MLLRALLLRTDDQEVHDHEDQQRTAGADIDMLLAPPALRSLGDSRRDEHSDDSSWKREGSRSGLRGEPRSAKKSRGL